MRKNFIDYLVIFSIAIMSITVIWLIYDVDDNKKTQVIEKKLILNTGKELEEDKKEEIETINDDSEKEQQSHDKEDIVVTSIEPVPIVPSDPNLEVASEVVNYALNFVGNPYVYGGNSLTEGTDCSGFTSLVYANFGIFLPRSSYDQANVGVYVPLENIVLGDLVLYGYDGIVSHVAIYIGNNEVIHALNSNVGIVVTDYQIMPIISVRRVL